MAKPPPSQSELLDRYKRYLIEERWREHRTFADRRRTLVDFWDHARKQPHQVTPRDLYRFLSRPLADSTRATYASQIKTAYRWWHSRKLLPVDPFATVRTPPARVGPPRALPLPNVHRLLQYAGNDRRLHTMVWLAYGAGLRVGEIAALRVEDCRFGGEPTIRVVGKGHRERLIPLHPTVARVLQVHLAGRPTVGPVVESTIDLGRPISAARVSKLLSAGLHNAGINATGHQLRHTFATELLAAGHGHNLRAVSALLGHSDLKVTQRYVSAYNADAHAAVLLLPDPRTSEEVSRDA